MKCLGPKYFRQRKKVEEMQLERMQHIAMYFQDQHLDRIDRIELIEKLMWDNYRAEKEPTKKVNILVNIMHMQTFLSAYYDTTRYVLETEVKTYREIEKSPHTYLSIDIRRRREKEREEEKEKRMRHKYNEKQAETIRQNNEFGITYPLPKAIEDVPALPQTVDTPIQEIETKQEEEPEPKPESEAERYWRTHKIKPRPKDNTVHYTTR